MKDDEEFKKALADKQVPILVLDERSGIGFLLCMASRTKFMKRKMS